MHDSEYMGDDDGEDQGAMLCKEASVDRNTATRTQTLKSSREGRKTGREPKENNQHPRKPTETQGLCPDVREPCFKALTVRCFEFAKKV